jgi:hypothetical protein
MPESVAYKLRYICAGIQYRDVLVGIVQTTRGGCTGEARIWHWVWGSLEQKLTGFAAHNSNHATWLKSLEEGYGAQAEALVPR